MSQANPIAGDFLSLLASRQVIPLRSDSNSAPVQTQATTVFAFHYADGVLMAGDRRATAGNIIVTDRVDKIIEIDGTSLLAIAGVPATAFETAGAAFDAAAVRSLFDHFGLRYLSEVMNFPAVLAGDRDIYAKLHAAHDRGLPIDGHAPGLRGDDALVLRHPPARGHVAVRRARDPDA